MHLPQMSVELSLAGQLHVTQCALGALGFLALLGGVHLDVVGEVALLSEGRVAEPAFVRPVVTVHDQVLFEGVGPENTNIKDAKIWGEEIKLEHKQRSHEQSLNFMTGLCDFWASPVTQPV